MKVQSLETELSCSVVLFQTCLYLCQEPGCISRSSSLPYPSLKDFMSRNPLQQQPGSVNGKTQLISEEKAAKCQISAVKCQ